MILSFAQFYINELWDNGITGDSRESSVTSKTKYEKPEDFKKSSEKVGEVGGLHIYSHESGGGMTHFTWSPKDKMIHHVVHAAEKKDVPGGGVHLKFLSAHGRKDSPVRMGHVYSHLIKNHDRTFEATGHSVGAQKMWQKFHNDSGIELVGRHPDGSETRVKPGDKIYASKKTTDPEEKKLGRMTLIARKRTGG